MKKIIFLCHGNICRSVMAEYIFKDKINKLNLIDKYEVTSKALSNEEIGNDIYPPAKRVLDKHNIKYDRHYASRFTIEDYNYYDEIYIMDKSNQRLISYITDDKDNKIKFLNGEISDPWYSGDFDGVFKQISEGIDKIINA